MTDCVSRDLLVEFVAGRLEAVHATEVAAHLAECGTCEQAAHALTEDPQVRAFQQCHRQQPVEAIPPASLEKLLDPLVTIAAPRMVDAAAARLENADRESDPAALGRFRLLRRLGAGGFGVVYLAEDVQLNRQVALKVPRTGTLADPDARQRFLGEARAAAALHHPQIVAVYDAGECDGAYYLASAYCAGATLREWMNGRGGPAASDEAATIVLALAEAADHAHVNGVLHRDIKPANVLLEPAVAYRALPFCPKLTDFGIAKLLDGDAEATATHVLIGTPRYMAPEQVSGRRDLLGPACDIYALGVVLYELLTSEPPIRGDDSADTLRRVMQDEPVAPRRRVRSVPRDLEAICLKCLEKSPEKRYASAHALAEDLKRYLERRPTVARPISPWERAARWVRRRPAVGALIASAVAGILFAVGGLALYNINLGKANSDLENALTDARNAQQRAAKSDQRTRQLLYVSDMRLAARAWREGDPRGMIELLRRHIPEKGDSDLRGPEWWYLWRQAEVPTETFAVHPSDIYYLCVSPNGKTLAAAGRDPVVRLYDLSSRAVTRSIDTGQGEVNGVSFSPDGEQLATAGDDGAVRLWRIADGQPLLAIPAHAGHAFQTQFTPDGNALISCGEDPVLHLWDARTGRELASFASDMRALEALAISPDGRMVASGGLGETALLWNAHEQTEPVILERHGALPAYTSAFQFFQDGQCLAAGCTNGIVRIWEVGARTKLASSHQPDGIHSLVVTPDGRYLACGDSSGMISLLDLAPIRASLDSPAPEQELRLLRKWRGHEGIVTAMRCAGNDRLLSAGADGKIQSWSISRLLAPRVETAQTEELDSPQFTSDGRLLARAERDHLVRWRLADASPLGQAAVLPQHGKTICSDRQGDHLAICLENGDIEFWDTRGDRKIGHWKTQNEGVPVEICLSPKGSLLGVVGGAGQHEIRVYRVGEEAPFKTHRSSGALGQLCFSPRCDQLAFSPDTNIVIWSLGSGAILRIPEAHAKRESLTDLKFSPDGALLASCGTDRLVKLWDPRTGEPVATLAGHRERVLKLAFSPDGRSLFSVSNDKTLKVWNVAAREELFDLLQHESSGLLDVRTSPDGRWLAAITADYGRLWLFRLGAPPMTP